MPLPTPTRSAQRYLGDSKEKRVHDLLREQPQCRALDLIAGGTAERFLPDKVEFALSLGYEACPYCLPEYAVAEPDAETAADESAGTADGEAETPDDARGADDAEQAGETNGG